MRTIRLIVLTIFTSVFFSLNSFGQCVVSNNSFETWQTDTIPTWAGDTIYYEHPTNWMSIGDLFGSIFSTASTFVPILNKTTDNNSGTYATRIDAKADASGDLISYGYCNTRPKYLNGHFKFNGESKDTFFVYVYMIYEDPNGFLLSGDTSTAIGSGEYVFTGTQSSYGQFSVDISYKSAATADTFLIFMGTINNDSVSPLISLFIDDLSFGNTNSLDEMSSISITEVYPNPSGGLLNIVSNSTNPNANVVLFDYAGKQVYASKISLSENEVTTLDLQEQHLTPGIYVLKLYDGKGTYSRKIQILE
ncbi:T9SS type A sorting domain-containing protein [Bacteroidota bacterium]